VRYIITIEKVTWASLKSSKEKERSSAREKKRPNDCQILFLKLVATIFGMD